MAKKNMRDIQSALTPIVQSLPTQHVGEGETTSEHPSVLPAEEARTQLAITVRTSLKDQVQELARRQGMTMQVFVLRALQAQGIDVVESDLVDLRKRKRKITFV